MAIAYFDSSALVKLVVEEDGSDLVATLWDQCDLAVSSRLAYPEVRAALGAAHRGGRMTGRTLDRTQRFWEQSWANLHAVALTPAITVTSGELAVRRALSGGDAVHLASAATLAEAGVLFVAWDQRLREGAHAEGLAVVPAL